MPIKTICRTCKIKNSDLLIISGTLHKDGPVTNGSRAACCNKKIDIVKSVFENRKICFCGSRAIAN